MAQPHIFVIVMSRNVVLYTLKMFGGHVIWRYSVIKKIKKED